MILCMFIMEALTLKYRKVLFFHCELAKQTCFEQITCPSSVSTIDLTVDPNAGMYKAGGVNKT